jgi:NAD(P)-dependent dehydrogenase (short-subunit alcohol dehydrogenase family)
MKWTLVTGAAVGLGAEICRYLAQSGHAVVIHYNTSEKEAQQLAADCQFLGAVTEIIQGDFSTLSFIQDFIKRYQARFVETRFLVNNVGNYIIKKALETDITHSYDLFQTNVEAPLFLIQALADSMKKEKGAVVNIGTSGINSQRADSRSPIYGATKAALWSLTRSLARELAPSHVRVNMVSPGQLERSIGLPEDNSHFPMGRPGTAREVARVVNFLLEDGSESITGQNIEVAGGFGL